MATIISICNQKGGVGKSSSAIALVGGLTLSGKRTLLFDYDAQGNSSYAFGVSPAGDLPNSYDVVLGKCAARDAIIKTAQGDIIPASPNLAMLDSTLKTDSSAAFKLADALKDISRKYDYIIIDTPPSLGMATIEALTAAASVVIPTEADAFSLQGIGQLYQTIQAIQQHSNPKLKLEGLLITRYDQRTILSRDKAKLLYDTAKALNTKLFKLAIRECVAIKESHDVHQDIFTYAPKSNAAHDYANFVKEIRDK